MKINWKHEGSWELEHLLCLQMIRAKKSGSVGSREQLN